MDWIAMILSVIGLFFNARKKIICWPIWMASTFVWSCFAIWSHQPALLLMNMCFFVFNGIGWCMWQQEETRSRPKSVDQMLTGVFDEIRRRSKNPTLDLMERHDRMEEAAARNPADPFGYGRQ